jgi:hypothetical protein
MRLATTMLVAGGGVLLWAHTSLHAGTPARASSGAQLRSSAAAHLRWCAAA